MTTCTEVLRLAAEQSPLAARDLLLSYEEWWRRRGDRQAARYWRGEDRDLAVVAADNYDWAATVRAAARRIPPPVCHDRRCDRDCCPDCPVARARTEER